VGVAAVYVGASYIAGLLLALAIGAARGKVISAANFPWYCAIALPAGVGLFVCYFIIEMTLHPI